MNHFTPSLTFVRLSTELHPGTTRPLAHHPYGGMADPLPITEKEPPEPSTELQIAVGQGARTLGASVCTANETRATSDAQMQGMDSRTILSS